MSPCILSKKTGDSYMTLVKGGLIINLPCEQATHKYSLGKRILWFFSGCPCEFSILRCLIKDPGWPSLSCQRAKNFGSLNFWFTITYNSIGFIVVWYNLEEKVGIFFHYKLLAKYNGSKVKIFYIISIHSFNIISIYADIFKTKQISFGFARI